MRRSVTAGRASAEVTKGCLEDPTFTLGTGGGFCYSTVPAVVGAVCTKA
ncbi:MAG: hypothetical protein JNL79_09275, partial [Myxococcales bacterium]|nr:hypothetical protein [Myxococcales bacterium]